MQDFQDYLNSEIIPNQKLELGECNNIQRNFVFHHTLQFSNRFVQFYKNLYNNDNATSVTEEKHLYRTAVRNFIKTKGYKML